jgi:hypothetical protein
MEATGNGKGHFWEGADLPEAVAKTGTAESPQYCR